MKLFSIRDYACACISCHGQMTGCPEILEQVHVIVTPKCFQNSTKYVLEKPVTPHLIKKLPTVYGTQTFITMITAVHHCPLS